MLAGFKTSLNDFLKELVSSPEKLKDYGQHTLIYSEKTNGFREKERKAVELMEKLPQDGIDKLMTENKLDTRYSRHFCAGNWWLHAGYLEYPGITVPAGYDSNGMPFGICFGGLKGTEPKLVEVAYASEQATTLRGPPFSKLIGFTKENLCQSIQCLPCYLHTTQDSVIAHQLTPT